MGIRPVLMNLDLTQLKIADRIKNNILPSTLGLFDIVTEVVEGVSVIKVLVSNGLEKYIISKVRNVSNGLLHQSQDVQSAYDNDND